MSEPGQILIADDVPLNREFLAHRLAQMGHTILTAADGGKALEILRGSAVDLLLLDIEMPVKTGYEVLEEMRKDERLNHIPVIVVSALTELDSVVRCIELGADDYLFKPFNAVLLHARVTSSLEKKRLRDKEHQHMLELAREREKSENLLRSIFPGPVADRLKKSPGSIAESFAEVTVLFADLHDFSRLTEGLEPRRVVEALNTVFTAFDRVAEKFMVEKIKTIGDAYMAAAGVPTPHPHHAAAVADLALAMQQELPRLSLGLSEPPSLRIGVNSGSVVAGVIGSKRFSYDVWGETVNTAAQMESFGMPGAIQLTDATQRLLAADYHIEERGSFYVKGKGDLVTYLLLGKKP